MNNEKENIGWSKEEIEAFLKFMQDFSKVFNEVARACRLMAKIYTRRSERAKKLLKDAVAPYTEAWRRETRIKILKIKKIRDFITDNDGEVTNTTIRDFLDGGE